MGTGASGPGDGQLVRDVLNGDRSAYAVLWTRHRAHVTEIAGSLVDDADVEDLVSEVFVRVLASIRSGTVPRDTFHPYLKAALRDASITWRRVDQHGSWEEWVAGIAHPDARDFTDEYAERLLVRQTLNALPPRWRHILWLLDMEGLKPREVATSWGLSTSAVSALAQRARTRFRQLWLDANTAPSEKGCTQ